MKESEMFIGKGNIFKYEYDCSTCKKTHRIFTLEVLKIQAEGVSVKVNEMDLMDFITCPILVRVE